MTGPDGDEVSDASDALVHLGRVLQEGLKQRVLVRAQGVDVAVVTQSVLHQVRDGRLERGFSEWQHSAGSGGQVGGAVQSLIWQPILMDVRSMRVRG